MVLPEGDKVHGITATEYIFDGVDNRFRLLLRSIYLFINPPHVNPFNCGLFDLPNDYYECLNCFKEGGRLYQEHHKSVRETLRSLGAK